jgi:hypothetical protein
MIPAWLRSPSAWPQRKRRMCEQLVLLLSFRFVNLGPPEHHQTVVAQAGASDNGRSPKLTIDLRNM